MTIIDNYSLLTSKQRTLLKQNACKLFLLGEFMSLDDIVTKLKVDVHIEPGMPARSVDDYYDKAIAYRRKVYDQLYKKCEEDESLRDEFQKEEVKLWRLRIEREAHSSMRLLGRYDSRANVIQLFPEAMADADASKMDEYLVSTFAHEVMHAYFNRPGHEKYPYAMFVEEPLAEFGMLLYLWRTNSPYYDWAYNEVRSKKCCYRYGAAIMDLFFDGDSFYGKYLENYKVPVGEYEMLSNGRVSMPMESESVNGGNQNPAIFVDINGRDIIPQWQYILKNPPRYFLDKQTGTLGLDGEWNDEILHSIHRHRIDRYTTEILFLHRAKNLYLGANFLAEDRDCIDFLHINLEDCNIIISPTNKYYKMVNGIVMSTSNGEVAPLYELCGRDRYCIPKNGKLGVYDCHGIQIVPCKYDSIWSFDDNGLCMVRLDVAGGGYLYGYVNEQGKEQIPVEYEHVYSFENGVTTAKKDGRYGIIDEHNNIVHPFDLNYPDMREIRNGYATMKDGTGKWGAIDSTGKVVIPCIYDSLVIFDEDGLAKVEQNGEGFIIDRNGNKLM